MSLMSWLPLPIRSLLEQQGVLHCTSAASCTVTAGMVASGAGLAWPLERASRGRQRGASHMDDIAVVPEDGDALLRSTVLGAESVILPRWPPSMGDVQTALVRLEGARGGEP